MDELCQGINFVIDLRRINRPSIVAVLFKEGKRTSAYSLDRADRVGSGFSDDFINKFSAVLDCILDNALSDERTYLKVEVSSWTF